MILALAKAAKIKQNLVKKVKVSKKRVEVRKAESNAKMCVHLGFPAFATNILRKWFTQALQRKKTSFLSSN